MLAVALVVMLGQCSKDTDCKGDRVCVDGQCVGEVPLIPRPAPFDDQRFVRVAQLKRELKELHDELDDATLGGPIFKLGLGGAATAAAAVLLGLYNPNYTSTAGAIYGGIVCGAVAVAMYIWGGIQLRLRLNARRDLPDAIQERWTELDLLQQSR